MKKKVLVFLLLVMGFMLVGCSNSKKSTGKLRYGIYNLGTNLNPFFYESTDDKTILNLSYLTLFTKDREGNILYDIKDMYGKEVDGYVYNAPGSLTITNEDDKYTYTIALKDDIYTSTGNLYTINDLIFNFYVLFDPSSELSKYMNLPIVGLSEYYDNLTNEDTYEDAHIEGIRKVSNKIMSLEMTRELTSEEKELLNIYLVPNSNIDSNVNISVDYNMFGFKKGDVSNIKNRNINSSATGPYVITSSSEKKVTLKRNGAYYYGPANIETVEIIKIVGKKYDEDGYCISGGDPFYQIDEGWMDLATVNVNDTTLNEIPRYNRNNKLVGNALSLYEIGDTKLGIVYSSIRFDGRCLEGLGLTKYHTILDEITTLNLNK